MWLPKFINRFLNSNTKPAPYNEVPDRAIYNTYIRNPWSQKVLINTSIQQDLEGSHYHGMLNTLSNDSVGPCPLIIGQTSEPIVDQNLEDRWLAFCEFNEIGSSMRLLRRAACKTGIGIGIPYIRTKGDDVKLGIRVISRTRLVSPIDSDPEDRIFDGIEYNQNWEPIKIYLDTEESYNVSDILLWWKRKDEDLFCGSPECGPALCILPSVKRYLDAWIRSAEFRASMPLSVRLDPLVWGKEAAVNTNMPRGKFEYEPGIVPTLPPGTSLEGIPTTNSTDDIRALGAMVGAAARCINMPLNLATGNSSDHNMASSQVDFGPWKNAITIDRQDFATVNHQLIKMWMDYGVAVSESTNKNYFSIPTRKYIEEGGAKYTLASSSVFNHPDPLKISNSILTDLISGKTTLAREYAAEGRNVRREIQREADWMEIKYEELIMILLANRTPSALAVLQPETQEQDQKGSGKN